MDDLDMVFTGREGVSRFRALVVAQGLELYAKTGVKANRAFTPSRMIAVASDITGQSFRLRDYVGAAAALRAWLRA